MKKTLLGLSLLAMISFTTVSCDDDDKVISDAELPKTSQDFIASYFGGSAYSRVEKEGKNYSVKLGERGKQIEIDFDAQGNWTEVDGDDGVYIPTAFILDNIVKYVGDTYPNDGINGIEKIPAGFEVDLVVSDIDLIFNSEGAFVRQDR